MICSFLIELIRIFFLYSFLARFPSILERALLLLLLFLVNGEEDKGRVDLLSLIIRIVSNRLIG